MNPAHQLDFNIPLRQPETEDECMCSACLAIYERGEPDAFFSDTPIMVDGLRGLAPVYLCPVCASQAIPRGFTIGQRVRFVACPSLVGVIAQRRHDDEGGWLYTVRGCAEDRILGMYRREHLEAV